MTKAAQRDLAGAHVAFPARIDLVRADVVTRQQGMRHMSISGVQDKISLRLERGQLRAVDRDGTHLLKPIPSAALHLVEDVPANEHITMLAARTLGLRTAAQGLIRLADGELAYVTRRFDRLSDGTRLHQEDLGVLLGASPATRGPNGKYEASYEEMGRVIAAHSAASQ